jgi:cephalosporin-C deacetylase-like acetyl esterase
VGSISGFDPQRVFLTGQSSGGGFPIPASGVDYTAYVYVDMDLPTKATPIDIPGVLTLEPVTGL